MRACVVFGSGSRGYPLGRYPPYDYSIPTNTPEGGAAYRVLAFGDLLGGVQKMI